MDVKIGISQEDRASLPHHNPPPLHRVAIQHGAQPLPEEVHIIVRQEALLQVEEHSLSDASMELGGVLLGKAYQYDGRIFVEIEAVLPAHSNQHGPVHFTFTADAWARIHAERDAHYADLAIVGWFHTHPNLGVFYSSDDVLVHSTAFRLPWHVGLVVDPVRREACFFGWLENATLPEGPEIIPLSGYYELTDVQAESVTDWRMVHRPTLAEMRSAALYDGVKGAVGMGRYRDEAVYVAGNDLFLGASRQTVMVGGTILLLAFVLLLASVWSLNRRTQNLETAVLILAQEQMHDDQPFHLSRCPHAGVQILLPAPAQTFTVGDTVTLFGVANHPEARSYRVDVRPLAKDDWRQVDTFRWGRSLENLGAWNTAGFAPGRYRIRLMPVTPSNVPVFEAVCRTDVALLPAPTPAPTVTPAPTAAAPIGAPRPDEVPTPATNNDTQQTNQ